MDTIKLSKSTLSKIEKILTSNLDRIYLTMVNQAITPIDMENLDCFDSFYLTQMSLNGLYEHYDGTKYRIKGHVVLGWDLEGYVKMANSVLDSTFEHYDEEIGDVGSEILNTIIGNSKRDLRGQGILLEMSTPEKKIVSNPGINLVVDEPCQHSRIMSTNYGPVILILNGIIDL